MMSSRSRPLSAVRPKTGDPEYIKGHFKTYSFVHSDKEESLFDEDEDLKNRYLEKEMQLKKINEELEKKSSEIFKKIEKYRYHESPSAREETGQGDDATLNAPEKYQDYNHNEGEDEKSLFNSFDRKRLFGPYTSRSYVNFTGACTESNNENPYFMYQAQSSNTSSLSSTNSKRPSTANAALSAASSTSMSHTEASLRRMEVAKPLEGIEEKHQARLQKATESVLKCVQSKLVNYEHRLADMHLQYRQKIQENIMLEGKVKAMEEDRRRLLRTVQSLQSTTDKFSKSAENTKLNLNLKSQAFMSLKKELESLKKEIKQKLCLIQSLQTRLDRCTEENRRLKSQHQSTQLNMKQQHNEDKSSMDELKQKINQLEHQKSALHATVEKQTHLIKSLRNHKVSLSNILKQNKISVPNEIENESEET